MANKIKMRLTEEEIQICLKCPHNKSCWYAPKALVRQCPRLRERKQLRKETASG